MKKWMKTNKKILIMGAAFAAGSALTAILVCTIPNYILERISVTSDNMSLTNRTWPAKHGQASDEENAPKFTASPDGRSQRGGTLQIYFDWSIDVIDQEAPDWLSITGIKDKNGTITDKGRLTWTKECIQGHYEIWVHSYHLNIVGSLEYTIFLEIT